MRPRTSIYATVLTLLLSSATLHMGCSEKKQKAVSTVDAEKRWCAQYWKCELIRRKVMRSADLEAAGLLFLNKCTRDQEKRTKQTPALKQKLAVCLSKSSCTDFLRCSSDFPDNRRGEKARPVRVREVKPRPVRVREVKPRPVRVREVK